MIKRSVVTGVLLGTLLILVTIYPILLSHLGPGAVPAPRSGLLRTLLLVLSGAASLAVLVLFGSLAAWRNQVITAGQGLAAGAISGVVASLIFYVLLYAPTIAVGASADLWAYSPTRQALYPPNEISLTFIQQVTLVSYLRLILILAAGGILGGLEGAIVGLLRRKPAPARPSLLELLASPRPRRPELTSSDEVWKAGILAGLLGGGIIWLGTTAAFLSNLSLNWPAVEAAVRDNPDLITRALFTENLLVCLGPLFVSAALGIGALAVLLLGDPPRRHLSRFQAVVIAGVTAAVMVFLAVLQIAYFGLGISRYLAALVMFESQTGAQGGGYLIPGLNLRIDAQALAWIERIATSPAILIPAFYLVPAVLFAVVLVVVIFWVAPQAALYGLTLPLIFRRPVDRAARLARNIRNQPSSLLPRIYGLYANDDQAVQVLAHLAFLLKDQPAVEVVAAYHTLSTSPEEASRAITVIVQALASQQQWRWRAEVSELYRVLQEGLEAKTLVRITAIQAPPGAITSSLPVPLARSCEGIGQVLDELKKVERVDDLNTKLIFLNSAQAALLDLHRYVERQSQESQYSETLFPEVTLVHAVLDLWQGHVLKATKDLQGRADVSATLLAQNTGFAQKVRQCIIVTNRGLNVAQNIRLRIANGEGYQVVDGAEQQVDILGPQESRELEFFLAPDRPRRLRLTWLLSFDDAVDVGRKIEFADAMELVQETQDAGNGFTAQPFQRIFPIPYVTGTPLRTGEMFFGRQDVFEFVREHLVGAYQNNVIVLHGQRRTGKTSILYRLQQLLADSHVAVLIDMQGIAARGTADFLYAISDDIVYTLESHGIELELPERSAYQETPEFTFRSRFMRQVVGELDGRNLLLMFDEFEELQQRVEDGRLEPDIFSFLRNLMQHEPRVDFLFSGTHKLEDLGAEYWSILFNIAAYRQITFLAREEVKRLATEPVAPYGMEYDPLAIDRIIQITAGHPYFTQVVCHEMVAFHNEVERSYMTVTCVDQVLERIIERGEAHFKYIWAGARPDEQRVMLALTDLLPDAEAAANPAQMAEEIARSGYEISDEQLAAALSQLQARDILARSGVQSSLYRFKIDLIRRWIAGTRPSLWREPGQAGAHSNSEV